METNETTALEQSSETIENAAQVTETPAEEQQVQTSEEVISEQTAEQQPVEQPEEPAEQQPAEQAEEVVEQQPAEEPEEVAEQQPAEEPEEVAEQQPAEDLAEQPEEEKESAERYVTAVCANFRGSVKEVIFINDSTAASKREEQDIPEGRTVLLNASMRSENGNSAVLARELAKGLQGEYEILDLKKYLNSMEDLMDAVEDASTVVLCMPLYVDGLPSQLIRLMELFETKYQGRSKRIYVLSNMGLYESRQLVNLFEAVRQWCLKMGFEYCGGLGVSAGELIGTLMQILPFNGWPSSRIAKGMSRLLEAVNSGTKTDDLYTEPYGFPRWLYLEIANRNWNILAKKNGLKPEDLYRKL